MTGLSSGKKRNGSWTCHDADGNEIPAPSPAMESACECCKDTGPGCSCEHCECVAIDEDAEAVRCGTCRWFAGRQAKYMGGWCFVTGTYRSGWYPSSPACPRYQPRDDVGKTKAEARTKEGD